MKQKELSGKVTMKPNVEAQAANQARHVIRALRSVYACADAAEQDVIDFIEAYLRRHPLRAATMRQAALHEAGHKVAFEAEGMVAGRAFIKGTPFGRGGWGGSAGAWNRPYITPREHDLHALLSEARATLAGPLAEAAYGDGDIGSSIGELLEVHILVALAAKMLGREWDQITEETLAKTVDIVGMYSEEIHTIANMLGRQRTVYRPNCRKVLARIQTPPTKAAKENLEWVDIPRISELCREAMADALAARA